MGPPQDKTPPPTVERILEAPGERLCLDHGPLLADDLTSRRTGQRRKL